METYTQQLARFCSTLNFETVPKKVMEKTKWLVLDNLGIIVGAATLEFGKQLAHFARALQDREEASVLGFGFKSSSRNAAFVNGSLAETLEMQDGYTKGGVHPSSATISAALATAEWQKKEGKEFLTAVVAGYEAVNRVAEAMHPTHLSRGFQPTGTAGTIGAAAAAARILRLDVEQTFNAFGIAGFILPISTGDNLWGGYSVKPIHGGAAAKSGIDSVLLAQLGLKAAPLEGDAEIQKGFCRLMTDDPPRFEKMIDGLGEKYTIKEVYFKPHATCRANQGPVDIALDLSKQHRLNYQEIAKVLIKTHELAARTAGAVRTDASSSFTVCQFSMSYAVAGALIFGKAGSEQLTDEKIRDPKVQALAAKIKIIPDAELEQAYPLSRPAIMEITLKNGRKLSGRVDFPKGGPENPMTEEELTAKFLDLTSDLLGTTKARQAVDTVLDLDHLDSMEKLIAIMQPQSHC